jgi:hypothetical protein
MAQQIRPVVFAASIATLLLIGLPAQAKQCSAARPSNPHGQWWSWRSIDGRKCWYEGRAMIPKSSLQWAAQASAQSKAGATPKSVQPETANDPLDSQASVPDADSFESRWRARVRNN